MPDFHGAAASLMRFTRHDARADFHD